MLCQGIHWLIEEPLLCWVWYFLRSLFLISDWTCFFCNRYNLVPGEQNSVLWRWCSSGMVLKALRPGCQGGPIPFHLPINVGYLQLLCDSCPHSKMGTTDIRLMMTTLPVPQHRAGGWTELWGQRLGPRAHSGAIISYQHSEDVVKMNEAGMKPRTEPLLESILPDVLPTLLPS